MKRLKLFIPLLLFLALAMLFWRGLSLDPTAMPSALIDKPVPVYSLPSLQNPERVVTDAELRGDVHLLNVWATWCVACRVEHPFLNQLSEQGIRIVGINYKDDPAAAREWLRELSDPYIYSVMDIEGRLGIDLGVFGAPETYVVDPAGVIRYRHVGVLDESVWTQVLAPIVAQLSP